MEKLPKVCVIMSTYNGEKFLKEQIESILNQKNVDIVLHIFDDKSQDNTVNILREYEIKDKNIIVHENQVNKNFTYNFLDALFSFKDNNSFDFYAFADQDDFWMENKLIHAIEKIKETGSCTLYSSNLTIVNAKLEKLKRSMMSKNYVNKEKDELCKNIVTGCTIVIDNEFKNLATKYYPENIYLHDYWFALIANYCKKAHFIYDNDDSFILYRQHANNQIGEQSKFAKLNKFIKTKRTKEMKTSHLIKTFFCLYKQDITEKFKKIFTKIARFKFKDKIWLFFNIRSKFSFELKVKLLLKKY